MFKQLMVFKLTGLEDVSAHTLAERLSTEPFAPCMASQPLSVGWVSPRGGAHDPLVETFQNHWLLAFRMEKRLLPSSVVRHALAEKIRAIEQETGRKPGKKQQRDLKDDITLALLPRAFTQASQVLVWIDPVGGWLFLDAGSTGKADQVTSALMGHLNGAVLAPVQTAMSPSAAMSHWLSTGEPPHHYTVDQECELKASDTSRATVRYVRHALDHEEVARHISAHLTQGKVPTRLALTWQGRVSLTLTDGLVLKKIAFLEGVLPEKGSLAEGEDRFDANAVIALGELQQMWADMLEALGGWAELGSAARTPGSQHDTSAGTRAVSATGEGSGLQPHEAAASTVGEDTPPWA